MDAGIVCSIARFSSAPYKKRLGEQKKKKNDEERTVGLQW